MALEIAPFCGVRYDWTRVPLGSALCPPYDVIGEALARRLRAQPRNAIHIELPEGGPGTRYARAARTWRSWSRDSTLVTESEPCFYLVEQAFDLGGRTLRRKGLLAALGLMDRSARRVVPHERTFAKPKEDRLALLTALKANTSPIFLLYPDPRGLIRAVLDRAVLRPPEAEGGAPDGSRVRAWRLREPTDLDTISRAFRAKTVLVADGHHRLEVAKEHWRRSGRRRDGSVLVYLCAEEDPGLVVLPTHRVVVEPSLVERVLAAAGPGGVLARECRVRAVPAPASLERALARASSPFTFGLFAPGRGRRSVSALAVPSASSAAACRSGLCVEWLQRRLLDDARPGDVLYTHGFEEALALARQRRGAALLLGPMEVADIRRAVDRVGLLPQKSTYFYPKIGSGVVFKPA